MFENYDDARSYVNSMLQELAANPNNEEMGGMGEFIVAAVQTMRMSIEDASGMPMSEEAGRELNEVLVDTMAKCLMVMDREVRRANPDMD